MKTKNKESYFWTSYSDLMTSLFFIMLVLFVLIIVVLHNYNKQKTKEIEDALAQAKATVAQLEQVMQLEKQFEELSKSTTLQYDETKKMFVAKDFVGIEIFFSNQDRIKEDYLPKVDEVGQSLKSLIKNLYEKNPDLSFQLVIEGNAAIPWQQLKDKNFNPDNKDMYELSYRRALALYMRWKKLNLRQYNTEIIIAGSGFNGINRDTKIEDNNKRFVIQIIPKIKKFDKK
ncbi:MAG: hypothetical protein K6F33_13470 [Bacteroidales bacterium]|nr:hypothetical protein [Bacteroidales bacterium]